MAELTLREQIAYVVAEIDASQDLAAELAIADRILAIPRIVDALDALFAEEGYSSIYDAPE